MTGPSRRGGLVGVMCRTCLLLRADFFAFRFVSDFRRRQPIVIIQEIFSDGPSETKWPSPPKRNALPKRAGKPPEGSRRNLRETGGEKISGGPAWPAAKKPSRDGTCSGPAPIPGIGRLPPDVPVPCARNFRTRTAHQVRQVAASIRGPGFTSPVLFAGATPLLPVQDRVRWRGRRAWMLALHPASRMGNAPRILLLTRAWPNMQAGTGICSGPGRGNCATPGFIRTDVGMPVADDRIDMCRTGPPCNATAGKAGKLWGWKCRKAGQQRPGRRMCGNGSGTKAFVPPVAADTSCLPRWPVVCSFGTNARLHGQAKSGEADKPEPQNPPDVFRKGGKTTLDGLVKLLVRPFRQTSLLR